MLRKVRKEYALEGLRYVRVVEFGRYVRVVEDGRRGRHGGLLLMIIWGRVLQVVRVRRMNSPERVDAKAHPRFEMSGGYG